MNKKLIKILAILLLFTTFTKVYAIGEDEEINLTEKLEEVETTQENEDEIENNEQETPNANEYENQETKYKLKIIDDAELFSDDEEVKLKDQMISLTSYGNIILVTLKENSMSTAGYAEYYYHKEYGTSSGSIFVIDMDNRNVYIFSDGANYRTITKRKATSITDNVYTYATAEQYYKCASKVFEQMLTLLEGGKIAEPMRHISNFVLAITTAFFINFFIVLACSKVKKASNKEVLGNCNIRFDIGEITGTVIGEHRVYNPHTDSSSGGGGGGGGGGGSSGGGGGHSF